MNMIVSLTLAAAVSMAALSAAVAKPFPGSVVPPADADIPQATATISHQSTNILSLNRHERKLAWNDLRRGKEQQVPYDFYDNVGAVAPEMLKLRKTPAKVVKAVPQLKDYDVAMVKHKLLIVNPANRKIAEVLSPR